MQFVERGTDASDLGRKHFEPLEPLRPLRWKCSDTDKSSMKILKELGGFSPNRFQHFMEVGRSGAVDVLKF
jgi:hypothetical protein